MKLKGIHHNEITVRDLDESLKFYTDVLGLEPSKELKRHVKEMEQSGKMKNVKMDIAVLQVGEDRFELIQYLNREGKKTDVNPWDYGAQHIAFEVDDVQEVYEKLKKTDVEIITHPEANEEFGANWMYFKDPDGGTVEAIEFY